MKKKLLWMDALDSEDSMGVGAVSRYWGKFQFSASQLEVNSKKVRAETDF